MNLLFGDIISWWLIKQYIEKVVVLHANLQNKDNQFNVVALKTPSHKQKGPLTLHQEVTEGENKIAFWSLSASLKLTSEVSVMNLLFFWKANKPNITIIYSASQKSV